MKLLIITQKVDINDDNLGFFHSWLQKFSERLDEVYVICLWKGEFRLPDNVHVLSMGKERGVSRMGQLFLLQRYLLQTLPKVGGVFVHMCPIYAIASFPLSKLFRRKIVLWFLHRNISWKLRLSEKLVDEIVTASEESFQMKSKNKVKIIRHGIDVDLFKPPVSVKRHEKFVVLSVGRISPIKNQDILIIAADILINKKGLKDIIIKFIGTPIEKKEEEYLKKLKGLVNESGLKDYVDFLGGKPHQKIIDFYQTSDVLVNLSPTGGMDKVVLEAMACEKPVLVCNNTFKNDINIYTDKLIFKEDDPEDLADKIVALRGLADPSIGPHLREVVVERHNLNNLIGKIINEFKK